MKFQSWQGRGRLPARVDKAHCGGHNQKASQSSTCARMAELADALASGASSRKGVEVRVLFRAPISPHMCIFESSRSIGSPPWKPDYHRSGSCEIDVAQEE